MATKAPICDHRDCQELHRIKTVTLSRCRECGIISSSRCRESFDAAARYENFYRNEMAGRFGWGLEHLVRLFRFFRALKIFTVSPRARSILDIGSGRGFTLYYLKKYYKYNRTVGTQISKNAYEFSKNKLGLEIYNQDLLTLSGLDGGFDLVTIWHVLEHVSDPERTIDKIAEFLGDRGKLIIEVPNYNSWSRVLTGKYWLSFDLDHHLYFFTSESLSALLAKHGFKIRDVRTFSLEYSTFTSAQSIVSALTGTESYFFRELQAGTRSVRVLAHAFLIILLAPLCFLINLLLYFSKRGEVLFILAEKQKQ
ncbi:MAG: class I SAM-dependent methyltransferase [Candidatus Omnitrophota bacterium]